MSKSKDAINDWIVKSVSMALTNDAPTYHRLVEALIHHYRKSGEWNFRFVFEQWLTSQNVPEGTPVALLLYELMDLGNTHLDGKLVDVFLEEDDRAEVEGSGRD